MRKAVLVAAIVLVALAGNVSADDNPRPSSFEQWFVEPVMAWSHAAGYLVFREANGVLIAPTGDVGHPWVILYRVNTDFTYRPLNGWRVEKYPDASSAAARVVAIGPKARLISTADGAVLVFYKE